MNRFITVVLVCFLLTKVWSGHTIQDFRLKDVGNQWRKYSDLKGEQLTIIDFWATWCSPCIKALPKLNEIYNKYQKNGVHFIGLNIDGPRNNAKIKPFIRAHKITYPVLKDPNSQLASRLNIINVPTLLIINSENQIVYRHQGYRSGDEKIIEAEIKRLLGDNNDD